MYWSRVNNVGVKKLIVFDVGRWNLSKTTLGNLVVVGIMLKKNIMWRPLRVLVITRIIRRLILDVTGNREFFFGNV